MNKKNNNSLTDLATALRKNLKRRKSKSKKVVKLDRTVILPLFMALFLTCCKYNIKSHGSVLDQYDISILKPHETTVEDVVKKIGVPTVTEGNKFVYLNSEFENVIFFKPKITKMNYLILTFDNSTLVNIDYQKVRDMNMPNYDDSKVQFSVHKSPIWDQITRNIGKFNTNVRRREI